MPGTDLLRPLSEIDDEEPARREGPSGFPVTLGQPTSAQHQRDQNKAAPRLTHSAFIGHSSGVASDFDPQRSPRFHHLRCAW